VTWRGAVIVQLKPVVNDPQGIVVRDGLQRLGFDTVRSVRAGKYLEIELDAPSESEARDSLRRMCEQLLRNPVIEDYRIEDLRPMASGEEVAAEVSA
jgi:phosphoribosylformylglycinamidine synthase